ncbi:methyltransferase domain-containing protein [Nostoc sp. FACHB-152]|uniref:class I SAM-dependent methyltransferase n=1 Tax=unclassified Nostoc TaxID=2593658 RepID=UPI001683245C|nr:MULTISPECIES: class I SAM-dependent methyltransferase [unclassified Nostoc]MBD2451222.1 methyltransferase domain-containing protein [Nostoc sp. FACHB-152]MBD2472234.1 methyltransferase domain-containing protein [Nostoc sp. FACHB-145]
MNSILTPKHNWDASLYQDKHAFVWQYGEDLLQWLHPKPGELILDLGCGTGQLTAKIAESGAEVRGIDSAATMIETARQNYPHLRFEVADARNFQIDKPLDAVFSNATLHWVKEADAAIASIYQALKPRGRFIAEFGGQGNVQSIVQALYKAFDKIGLSNPQALNPWYFPSISEYSTLLEKQGFEVTHAILFARPTPLVDGTAGMQNWIQMFGSAFLTKLSAEEQLQVIRTVEDYLQPTLYQNGSWTADYRRIRIAAIKV